MVQPASFRFYLKDKVFEKYQQENNHFWFGNRRESLVSEMTFVSVLNGNGFRSEKVMRDISTYKWKS